MTLNGLSSMILLALFIIAAILFFMLIRKKKKDTENFDANKEYTLLASSIIFASIAGFGIYTVQKELLIAAFIEDQKIICIDNNKGILVTKEKGYTFQKDRFFRNQEVYKIEDCKKF